MIHTLTCPHTYPQQAKATRDAIAADAEAQLSVLKEDEMKAIIDRADGISLVQETVEHLRKLLFDTSEDAFVKLQLKAAVGLKDQERIINKTIRLKELFFEKAGVMFEFKNFPGLLSPAAWAGKKFLCFDREALAASKLVWSKQPIHAPLSRIRNKDKVATKAVIRLYKNVLAYMGDRKYEFPVILAQELLQQALDSKLVR